MALYDGWKGLATIKRAFMTKAETGTWGICMGYATDDGNIEHTWWMTHGTADRLAENLNDCFGIERDKLNAAFLRKIGEFLTGKMCRLTIKEEEYRGKKRLVVQWMNPAGGVMKDDDFTGAAALFGAEDSGDSGAASNDFPPPDDGIPF